MSDSILSPTFLFRYAAPCRRQPQLWTERGLKLPDECIVPCFGELEGRKVFADLRAGWNDDGLGFQLTVTGKQQPPWCRTSRPEDSDGLQLWLDTRDSHNMHRANRFCHRFVFLPVGGGSRLDEPAGAVLPINRAKEHPKLIKSGLLRVMAALRADGYTLHIFIPGDALTGFDPAEHPRLGFSYAVIDRELGWQTFSVGPEFPFVEDPTLWGTLELTDR